MSWPLTRIRPLQRLMVVMLLGGIASEACSDLSAPASHSISRPRVRPEWVIGDAARALDSASGLFRLNYPAPQWVSLSAADTFAIAIARSIGVPNPLSNAREIMEQDRGAPIDFDHLSSCERPLYAFSPFGAFPPGLPGYARRAWGPHWGISLCGSDATVQLSTSIPDNASDIQIVDGVIARARTEGGGNDFNSAGVPTRFPFGVPVTPEEAVAVIYSRTGRRTNTVPIAFNQLDDRGFSELAHCASWRLSTESPVMVRSERTGTAMVRREFFIRRFPACYDDSVVVYVASSIQPATWPLIVPHDTVTNNPVAGMDTLLVPLVGPVLFERVAIVH